MFYSELSFSGAFLEIDIRDPFKRIVWLAHPYCNYVSPMDILCMNTYTYEATREI